MGVLGAFVFAAQMVSFAIPGTGSSGHLGGGLLLAILIGPSAAFPVMVSVPAVQALFFGDGGLLALGCNILNLGFFTSFVAFPSCTARWQGRARLAGALPPRRSRPAWSGFNWARSASSSRRCSPAGRSSRRPRSSC